MRRTLAIPFLFLLAAAGGRAAADGEASGEPADGIFFRDPDRETAARIAELVSRMATGSVLDRTKARRELESIGYWSVDPLVDAVARLEPPIRCASILVLDAIRDRRAVEPLRAAVARETSHPYVAAFAALALGRFRDAGAVEGLRVAARTTKSMELLKAAVPLALARIRTPEARDVVLERVRAAGKEPSRNAALLALGFFPESALDSTGMRPGPDLAAGLANRQRRGERQAALLAFLVAASAHSDVKAYLRELAAAETAPEVSGVALIGLSRSRDADVTEYLAKTAARQGDDQVRELAADLLYDRVDTASKPLVVQTARSATSARLRAACVLALGRLEDDDARRLVLEKLGDRAPLVRAAAGVALTRRNVPGAREAAIAALEPRIRRGETNDDVRDDFEKARSILAGERTDVRWTEIGQDVLFSEMPLTYVQRLLRAVNLRMQASLDLAKIQNLQTDSEIVPGGPPSAPGDSNEHGEPSGSEVDPDAGDGAPAPPSDAPSGQPTPDGATQGAARTSQYQELRDLKVDLVRNPFFVEDDLPVPPTTPAGAK